MVSASQELPYNRRILRWARERRKLALETAAKRAAVSPEKISDWELGRSQPTVKQARGLAELYERPFLEFFAPSIPDLPTLQLVPDYRLRTLAPSTSEAVALEGVQEWAETQRLNAFDLYELVGEKPFSLAPELFATLDDKPDYAAERARKLLDFPIQEQLSLRSDKRYLLPAIIRGKIEAAGIIVLKQSGLTKAGARGMCLFTDVLPVIVVGGESPGGLAFTLSHELGHVALGESAISGPPIITHARGSHGKRVEGWCNSFAAAFLMPASAVKAHHQAPSEPQASISDPQLNSLANSFAVSRHAMLIRLTTLGLVNPTYYWRIKRRQFLAEEAELTTGGRPKYYGSRYRSTLGDKYTGLVLEALATGHIGHHSASEFMGIENPRHLEDIRVNFGL